MFYSHVQHLSKAENNTNLFIENIPTFWTVEFCLSLVIVIVITLFNEGRDVDEKLQSFNSEAREWRHDSDKIQANKLEWWMILKISLSAKAGVPKTLVKQLKTSPTFPPFPSEHTYVD